MHLVPWVCGLQLPQSWCSGVMVWLFPPFWGRIGHECLVSGLGSRLSRIVCGLVGPFLEGHAGPRVSISRYADLEGAAL